MSMGIKFGDVDILDALGQIMELNTQHYKEDFTIDTKLIQKLSLSKNPEDKHLLWMSRPCGTYTLREREVFLQDTYEHKVWRFYHEQTKDLILAYALTLKGQQGGRVTGDIQPVDYAAHVERMKRLSLPIQNVTMTFEDGAIVIIPYQSHRRLMDEVLSEHENLKTIIYEPENEERFAALLKQERRNRDHHSTSGDIKEHIRNLQQKSVRGRLKEAKAVVPLPEKSLKEEHFQTIELVSAEADRGISLSFKGGLQR